MKWDKKNKDRLWRTLKAEVDRIHWQSFSETFGIDLVYRGHQICSPSKMWMQEANQGVYVDPWGQWYKPATSRNHVIIDDIFHDNPGWGLKIPKEVAEKFLILGVP